MSWRVMRVISPWFLAVAVVVWAIAFEISARMDTGEAGWGLVAAVPVIIAVAACGAWLGRRHPQRWVRAVVLNVPLAFVGLVLVYEVIDRVDTGRPGILADGLDSWTGVAAGAAGFVLLALLAAWLEPGAREARRRPSSPGA